jgi:hypothetical protein
MQNRQCFAVFIADFAEIGRLSAEIGNSKVKIGIFRGEIGKPPSVPNYGGTL